MFELPSLKVLRLVFDGILFGAGKNKTCRKHTLRKCWPYPMR
jgi:hypothetical protein